jgi:ubiquitin-protein ligase
MKNVINNNIIINKNYKMNFELFNSFHEILIPNEKYKIIAKNNLKYDINYFVINITYVIIDNKIKLIINEKTIESNHIFRIVQRKCKINEYLEIKEESITEYLLILNEILVNDNKNYCTICGNELNVKGACIITYCENEECKKKYYHIVTDNRVTELYNNDTRVFMYLINIFVSGLSHPKVLDTFKPLPFMIDINNVEDLKKIIPKELELKNHIKLMDKLLSSKDDLELYSKLEENSYCLLKNAISNNYFSMSSRENVIEDSSVVFININYCAEIENKFKQNYYLFHGSLIYSWYPIIKNGLKVMSGTSLQLNGASFGNGIYFSDSFETSIRYSQKNITGFNMICVGVFEIIEDPIKYKKLSNIFVIEDDTIILLRSLIITKPNSYIRANITNYFTKELPLQKKINKSSLGMVKNKRLNSEYKKLQTEEYIKEIKIVNENKWEIEFISINNRNIKIELEFSNYPITPPVIKIINPIKIEGLIDKNNIVLLQLTNPSNWNIKNNLVEINSSLYKCITESLFI